MTDAKIQFVHTPSDEEMQLIDAAEEAMIVVQFAMGRELVKLLEDRGVVTQPDLNNIVLSTVLKTAVGSAIVGLMRAVNGAIPPELLREMVQTQLDDVFSEQERDSATIQ